MKLTITEKKENKLLQRLEVQGVASFEGSTPKNQEIMASLAQQLQVAPELIVMQHIYTGFGERQAQVQALAYSTLEGRQKTEPLTKHMKKKIEEAKKKAAEAKPAEGG